ncbi:MAG: hypothetical protein AAGC67_02990 [Myxococcota bacterium]
MRRAWREEHQTVQDYDYLFIDGERTRPDSGERIPVISPVTEKVIGHVP